MTIDKLKKERSDLDGPKPIILQTGNLDSLFYLLNGSNSEQQSGIMAKPQLEFGCNQVILVKD